LNKNNNQIKTNTEDNLNIEQIRQLHNATLNFSNQCTEIKKLYVTVIIAVITLFFNIFKENYSSINFYKLISILILCISILFYLLDVCSYYYQKKLRNDMINIENKIKKRHKIKVDSNSSDKSNITLKSFFNSSMLIYYIIFLSTLLFLLYLTWRNQCVK